MDSRFATLTPQQTIIQDIPANIYHLLWTIALQGYEVSDVAAWYRDILRHTRPTGGASTEPTYEGFALASDGALDAQYACFLDTDCAARRATMATIDSCISPSTQVTAVPTTELAAIEGDMVQQGPLYALFARDNSSQAYNTPQSHQTHATTPQRLDATPEPSHSRQLVAAWSPAPSSTAEPDLYTLASSSSMPTGNVPTTFAGDAPTNTLNPYPGWFTPHDLGTFHTRTHSQQSQQSQLSLPLSQPSPRSLPPAPSCHAGPMTPQQQQQQLQLQPQPYLSPEYPAHLPGTAGTAMPVLVPYASSSRPASNGNNNNNGGGGSSSSGHYAKVMGPGGASLYSSTSGGYFPIIHVSSSRRRRNNNNNNSSSNKALQKGGCVSGGGVKKSTVSQPQPSLKGGRRQVSV